MKKNDLAERSNETDRAGGASAPTEHPPKPHAVIVDSAIRKYIPSFEALEVVIRWMRRGIR